MNTELPDRNDHGAFATRADRPVARMIVPMVLLVGSAVALRGRLPGAETLIPRERAAAGPGMTAAMLGLFGMSSVLILLSILGERRRTKGSVPSDVTGGGRWRFAGVRRRRALIVAAVLGVVVVLVGALSLLAPVARVPLWPETSEQHPGGSGDQPSDGRGSAPGTGANGLMLSLAAVLAAAMSIGVVVMVRGARSAGAPGVTGTEDSGAPVDPGLLAYAAEVGLAEVSDPGRSPRAAIIACYAAMEHALAAAPDTAPQASDTPSQVLARAVDHRVLHPRAAGALVGLFAEARFSSHLMAEQHRASAVRLLRIVQRDLANPR